LLQGPIPIKIFTDDLLIQAERVIWLALDWGELRFAEFREFKQ